mgnify:CR=1 FL=1
MYFHLNLNLTGQSATWTKFIILFTQCSNITCFVVFLFDLNFLANPKCPWLWDNSLWSSQFLCLLLHLLIAESLAKSDKYSGRLQDPIPCGMGTCMNCSLSLLFLLCFFLITMNTFIANMSSSFKQTIKKERYIATNWYHIICFIRGFHSIIRNLIEFYINISHFLTRRNLML